MAMLPTPDKKNFVEDYRPELQPKYFKAMKGVVSGCGDADQTQAALAYLDRPAMKLARLFS